MVIRQNTHHKKGFTIVELVIVIIVIAILATVVIVAYNGIQSRARESVVQVSIRQTTDKLELYRKDNGSYPSELEDAGINSTNEIIYEYTNENAYSYCVTVTAGDISYNASQTTTNATSGFCPGHDGSNLPATYTAYRFQPTEVRNDSSANSMSISEFQILVGSTRQAGTAYGQGNSSPGNEGPYDGNDNLLGSKYLDFTKTIGYMYIVYPSPISATGYRIGSANDATERDPISWEIYGSNDTTGGTPGTWTLLDTVTNYAFPTARSTYLSDFTLSL